MSNYKIRITISAVVIACLIGALATEGTIRTILVIVAAVISTVSLITAWVARTKS